jgi:hypothetical protein
LRLAASSACHSVISGSAIRVGLMAAPSSRACVRQGGPYLMPRALWGPSPSVSWLSRPPSVSRDKVASAFALILKDPDLTDQAGASKLGEADQGSWPAIECNAARVAIQRRPAERSERFALQDRPTDPAPPRGPHVRSARWSGGHRSAAAWT